MSVSDFPKGRPQGRPQQPVPRPTGRAAALHQGRPAPVAAPSGRAGALHNASGSATVDVDSGFDWSRLSEAQRVDLQRVLAQIRKSDPYFDLVYRTLASLHGTYGFALDHRLKSYGQFVPNSRERGGLITFRSIEDASNLETTNEECFHAYQNYLYGRVKMTRIGGSNIELEPKFLDMYKKIYYFGQGYAHMPGEERMINLLSWTKRKASPIDLFSTKRLFKGSRRVSAALGAEEQASAYQ